MVIKKCIIVAVLLQYFTQTVFSENVTALDSTADDDIKDVDGRRSNGVFVIKSAAAAGGHVNSQIESKSFASSSSSSSSASSGNVHGWVSEPHNAGYMVLQPPVVVHGHIQNQQGCPLASGQNILSASEQASLVHKNSAIENSHSFGGGSSINSHMTNENSWQLGQNSGIARDLATDHVAGGQSSSLQKVTSTVTTNKINENTIVNGNNQAVNTVYEETDSIHHGSMFYPENNYHKITLIESGDGLYANELSGQKAQNFNVMLSSESSNAPNIVAVPITRPQYGRVIVQGYRPNMQYYLSQIEASNLYNPSKILRVPSFVEQMKSDQMNLNLSEEQLNIYKQYLIQTGLIKLKPYQLIFSEQFRPKLKTLQWTVVPLNTNFEYCKQQCGHIFARNTLYSTLAENAGRLPFKLLVPVIKVGSGVPVPVTGAQAIPGATNDLSGGVYRMAQNSPSHNSS